MKNKLLVVFCALVIAKASGQATLTKTANGNTKLPNNSALTAQLDSIYNDDQNDRVQAFELQKKYKSDSKEVQDMWKTIRLKDSFNIIKVSRILDERGWLGADEIGRRGNETLFLVIQHSDQKTQEKYLPMMREAVKNGKAEANGLAFLEDRVAVGQGKKQIYGSQMRRNPKTNAWFVYPIQDPDNVDKRRASVGLGPMADYVTTFQLTWNLEQYKKDLPELEKLVDLK
jgi:hypothetical protein